MTISNHQNALDACSALEGHAREARERSASFVSFAALGHLSAAEVELQRAIFASVAYLRERGATWTQIGQALSISKQAARKRFAIIDAIARGEGLQPYA